MSSTDDSESSEEEQTAEEYEDKSSVSSSTKYYGDSIDFDSSSMKCFKEVQISSSSLFKHYISSPNSKILEYLRLTGTSHL